MMSTVNKDIQPWNGRNLMVTHFPEGRGEYPTQYQAAVGDWYPTLPKMERVGPDIRTLIPKGLILSLIAACTVENLCQVPFRITPTLLTKL